MKHKFSSMGRVAIALVLALSLTLVMAVPVSAMPDVTITEATGGDAISADTYVTGAYTELGAISIAEAASGDIGVGTIILNAPTGFEFRTNLDPDVAVTGTTPQLAAEFTTITTTQLTITVNTASTTETDNVLTIGGTSPIGVRPTDGTTAIGSDDILTTGSVSVIAGVTHGTTSFGTLTMVAGAVTQLAFTTEPAGSISGSALTAQPVVAAQDQFGNTDTAYVTAVVASTDDAGTLTGTLTVTPVDGVATFTDLVYTATADAETFQIDVSSGALTATSSDVVSYIGVTLTPASGGTAISADTAVGTPGVDWTTLGAIMISEGAFGDIATGSFVLTIPSGFEFNIASVPDVDVTGTTPQLAATDPPVIAATTITVTVTAASTTETDNELIIGGTTPIQVRPTAGTPLASGDILMTSGTIAGVTVSTNFGTLTMVVGAVTQLVFTTQPADSVSGYPLTTQPVVEAQDQSGNTDAAYVIDVVASTNDAGTLSGTLTVTPVAGVATFTNLVYTATADGETFQIDVESGALSATSSDVVSYIEVTLTPASGGDAISADTYVTGVYTELGPISIAEGAFGTIGTGTITLNAPTGFEFRTTLDPDVAVTGTTPQLAAEFTTITTTQLTITVNTASTTETDNVLTIGGTNPIGVRPTDGTTAIGSDDIVMDAGSTSTIVGVTVSTNFGTLTMVVGAVTQLAFTTEPAGSVSGSALTTQPVVEAQDQFGNTDAAYVTAVVASTDDAGTLSGTLTVTPVDGVATFTDLVYTATADAETFQIDVSSGALTAATSSGVVSDVVATKILLTTAPANIVNGVSMTQPVVEYVDADNITDIDITTDVVTVTHDGAILAGTTTATAALGVATFTNLVYTGTGGEAVTFTFTDNAAGAKDFSLDAVVSEVKVFDEILTLSEGWTLISTPLWISTDSAWIGEEPELMYKAAGSVFSTDVTLADLEPVEALYVKMGSAGGELGILYSTDAQGVSAKELVAGWNLISSANSIDKNAQDVLSGLRDVASAGTGLTTVVSQDIYNQNSVDFYEDATTWDNLLNTTLKAFDGYWIRMNADRTFAVVPQP